MFKLTTNTGGLTHTYQSGPTPGPGVGERKWPKENHSAIGLRMLSTKKKKKKECFPLLSR